MAPKKPHTGPSQSPGQRKTADKKAPTSKIPDRVRSETKYKATAAVLAVAGAGALAVAHYTGPPAPPSAPPTTHTGQAGTPTPPAKTEAEQDPESLKHYLAELESYLREHPLQQEEVSVSENIAARDIPALMQKSLTPMEKSLEAAIAEKTGLEAELHKQIAQRFALPKGNKTDLENGLPLVGELLEWLMQAGINIENLGVDHPSPAKQNPQQYLNIMARLINRRLLAQGFLLIAGDERSAFLVKVESVQRLTLKEGTSTFECALVRLKDSSVMDAIASFDNATGVVLTSQNDGWEFIRHGFGVFHTPNDALWLQDHLLPALEKQKDKIDPRQNSAVHEAGHAKHLSETDDTVNGEEAFAAKDIFDAMQLALLRLNPQDLVADEQLDELSRFGAQLIDLARISPEAGQLGMFSILKGYQRRRHPHPYALVDHFFGGAAYMGKSGKFFSGGEALGMLGEQNLAQTDFLTLGAAAKSLGEAGMAAIGKKAQK